MNEENIYSPPEANLIVKNSDLTSYEFFPTSKNKLAILFVSTLGLYAIYWFYKNWKLQEERMEKKILPALRSLFYIFFTHSLFSRIEKAANHKEVSVKWKASLLATVFVILTILSNVLDRASASTESVNIADYLGLLVLLAMLYPLYYIQGVVNIVNDDPHGQINNSYSVYNFIFIILGVTIWFLLFIGFFYLLVYSLNEKWHISIFICLFMI